MKKLISYFIRYPIWVTILMASVIVFGLISLSQMRYSFFPEREPRNILIEVSFPGASPEEIEEGIVLKIEENLDGLNGIERITSVSSENYAKITVETIFKSDIDKVLTDVKNAVDRISSFQLFNQCQIWRH